METVKDGRGDGGQWRTAEADRLMKSAVEGVGEWRGVEEGGEAGGG